MVRNWQRHELTSLGCICNLRYLELDAYLRALLANPSLARHGRLLDFLGVEKHGVRYGIRRYEYDSAQSEGNRYIRDNDL